MEKEPNYKVLGRDFGLRKKVELENGLVIKILDSDPYHYARVIEKIGDEYYIKHETQCFSHTEDEQVISKLKKQFG